MPVIISPQLVTLLEPIRGFRGDFAGITVQFAQFSFESTSNLTKICRSDS